MTRKEKFLQTLSETKIINVIRIGVEADMVPVMEALYKGGVKIIEITSTTPKYLDAINKIRGHFSSFDDVFVGAGTILSERDVHDAVKAGADFIVSPITDEDVIKAAVSADSVAMPGAMTPTEIVKAWRLGASVVKTFPGGICTPKFYKDMRGPFPGIKMMPTGNVNLETAPEYIKAGAVAVGVGKAISSEVDIIGRNYDRIEMNARSFSSILI